MMGGPGARQVRSNGVRVKKYGKTTDSTFVKNLQESLRGWSGLMIIMMTIYKIISGCNPKTTHSKFVKHM